MTSAIHQWRAFTVLAVSYFMTIIDLTIVNVSLPTIGRDLHFSPAGLQWVVSAYGLTFGGLLLLGGRAADLLGRRRLFQLGMALFTAASLACALARTDVVLIVMRGLQGAGAAVLLPAALALVTNIFVEGADRNKALGVWTALGALGATVGLITGGLLTRYAGWEYIYYLNLPVGVAALVLAPRYVPESRAERNDRAGRRFDALGGLTVTGAMLLLVYTISTAPADGWASAKTITCFATAGALLLGFLAVESHVTDPLLPLRMLSSRAVCGANAATFLLVASNYAYLFIGTLYLQEVLDYSALQTGMAWLATSLTSVALAGLSQRLVTRLGPAPVLTVGLALLAVAIAWTAQAPSHGRFWADLAGPLVVAGAATSFAFIPSSIAALTRVAPRDAGIASGLLNTARQLGGVIGVAVTATIAASRTSTLLTQGHAPLAALTGGFHAAFWVCGALAVLAVPIAALVIPREPTDADQATIGTNPIAAPALRTIER